jgi:hypothetical protein
VQPQPDINVRSIIMIGIIASILVLEIVVGVEAYFYNMETAEIEAKSTSQPIWELNNLVLQQQAEINSYSWIDRDKGIVAIPIDQAMEKIVRNRANRATTRPK